MKINNYLLILLIVLSYSVFTSCEKDDGLDNGVVGWVYTTDFSDNNISDIYGIGKTVEVVAKFNNFNGKKVSKVGLYYSIVDGGADDVLVNEYTDIIFIEEEQQYKVEMSFLINDVTFIDKEIQLNASFETAGGEKQTWNIAKFSVIEFEYIISGVNYFNMYDNTWSDAGAGFTIEHTAGFTAIAMLMHQNPFPADNSNFIGELGANMSNYTPDWTSSFYVPVYGNWGQWVSEIHDIFNTDAWWYGGSKRISSTEFGTYGEIDAAIENGQLVILHGNFRGDVNFDHQVVITAKNETTFLVNDPAGKWDGNVDGIYMKGANAGQNVKYSKADVYAAIGASGSVKMHVLVNAGDETLDVAKKKSIKQKLIR